MSDHTPGPWRSGNQCILADESPECPTIIANLIFIDKYGVGPCAAIPNQGAITANARLIAAAPDLFSLCEELLAYIQGVSPDSIGGPMWRRAVGIVSKATKGDQE